MPATLESRFPQIVAELSVKVGAAIKEGTEGIAEAAKANAPDPPPYGKYLKESIEARSGDFSYGARSAFGQNEASKYGFSVPVGRQVVTEIAYGVWSSWYSPFVEFGTSHSAPHPFLMPAAEEGLPEVVGLVNAALKSL